LMVGLTSPGVAQITDAVPDAQDIADALLLAPSGAAAAAGSVYAKLNALTATGIYSYSDTVTDPNSIPLDGARVLLATDQAFTHIVSFAYSNAQGAFTVRSDTPGTHYLRIQLAGYQFSDQSVELA